MNMIARPPEMGAVRSPAEASRANNELRLSVEQVSYAYSPNPTQAPLVTLEATSFQARAGEIVAILGPNASGKSTLLKLIAGTLEPLSGRVLLNGFVTHSLNARTRAQRIAMVQQEFAGSQPAGIEVWSGGLKGFFTPGPTSTKKVSSHHPSGKAARGCQFVGVNIGPRRQLASRVGVQYRTLVRQ